MCQCCSQVLKAWRSLNLLGFVFTFIVGVAWGGLSYQPALFSSTEPFLILFFLLYLAVVVLHAYRQPPRIDDYIDNTLIFGLPIITFFLQGALVQPFAYGLAWSSLGLALALTLVLAAPALGAPVRIHFEGVFYGCDGEDPEEWLSGNVLHFRNAVNENLWVTGNPLLDGTEINVVDGNINLKNFGGVAHPRSTLTPDAVDGTWKMEIKVTVGEDELTARGVGRGTGDLRGMTLFFRSPAALEIDPSDNPCSDLPFAAVVEGEILAPHGTP
jgi:hypothetical protein